VSNLIDSSYIQEKNVVFLIIFTNVQKLVRLNEVGKRIHFPAINAATVGFSFVEKVTCIFRN
jgi:hypothetical protein